MATWRPPPCIPKMCGSVQQHNPSVFSNTPRPAPGGLSSHPSSCPLEWVRQPPRPPATPAHPHTYKAPQLRGARERKRNMILYDAVMRKAGMLHLDNQSPVPEQASRLPSEFPPIVQRSFLYATSLPSPLWQLVATFRPPQGGPSDTAPACSGTGKAGRCAPG